MGPPLLPPGAGDDYYADTSRVEKVRILQQEVINAIPSEPFIILNDLCRIILLNTAFYINSMNAVFNHLPKREMGIISY